MADNDAWYAIFKKYKINQHDFSRCPFLLSAEDIKKATKNFLKTSQREVRVLCKQDTREARPEVFVRQNLFILPVKNGYYALVQGEGYVDIPEIKEEPGKYVSVLNFESETANIGNSEMQHLDIAYASSLVRTFCEDDSLVLSIRGRKYTSSGFNFFVNKQRIEVGSVQTEVDAGYEGKKQVVLVEAKNSKTSNTIIRQLFYPYRYWSSVVNKKIRVFFFEKRDDQYSFWEFGFDNPDDYNSIRLLRSASRRISKTNK